MVVYLSIMHKLFTMHSDKLAQKKKQNKTHNLRYSTRSSADTDTDALLWGSNNLNAMTWFYRLNPEKKRKI